MKSCLVLVFLFAALSDATISKIRRVKRDDASYANGVGGPVALVSESEAGEGGGGGSGGGAALETCELDLAKKLKSLMNVSTSDVAGAASSALSSGWSSAKSGLSSVASAVASGPSKIKEAFTVMTTNPKEAFDAFVLRFNKTYASASDAAYALASFIENIPFLQTLVFGRFSPFDATFGVTEFFDLKLSDFITQFTGALPIEGDEGGSLSKLDAASLIKRDCKVVNWTSINVVPEVRRQDKCGCCYAMSTADMIAAQYNIDNKKFNQRFSLSPQWLLNCMKDPAGFQCKGGRPLKVLESLKDFTKWNNIPLESCHPYKDTNTTCQRTVKCPGVPDVQVRWGKMVDISGPQEKEMMASLLQHGPVVAIVNVNRAWQMYNGTGIIRASQCSDKQNHAVLITGYDYSTCIPTYTIKNSWGTKWGGRGYIKLEAGKNTCAVAKTVVFTCTSDDCEDKDPIKYVLSKPKHPDCQK